MTPDPSYTSALGGLESNASITINGLGKNKKSRVYYCCWNNTIPKQVAPIDSIWNDCCCIMHSVHVQLL